MNKGYQVTIYTKFLIVPLHTTGKITCEPLNTFPDDFSYNLNSMWLQTTTQQQLSYLLAVNNENYWSVSHYW